MPQESPDVIPTLRSVPVRIIFHDDSQSFPEPQVGIAHGVLPTLLVLSEQEALAIDGHIEEVRLGRIERSDRTLEKVLVDSAFRAVLVAYAAPLLLLELSVKFGGDVVDKDLERHPGLWIDSRRVHESAGGGRGRRGRVLAIGLGARGAILALWAVLPAALGAGRALSAARRAVPGHLSALRQGADLGRGFLSYLIAAKGEKKRSTD